MICKFKIRDFEIAMAYENDLMIMTIVKNDEVLKNEIVNRSLASIDFNEILKTL